MWRGSKAAVVDCRACGFAHLLPLPGKSYFLDVYEKFPDYIRRHRVDQPWRQMLYQEKYDFFKGYFRDVRGRKVLDVGSGPGYFLKLGKQLGWQVMGIEPSCKAYQFCTEKLGLKVICDFFGKHNYTDFGTFDVIHLQNVLEHVEDPITILNLIHEILVNEGLLCVEVPNDFNPLQTLFVRRTKKDPWWVVADEHINYFQPASLSALLANAGFHVIYKTASFPLELFLLMGDDYTEDPRMGRKVHEKRKRMELVLEGSGGKILKKTLYEKFCELNLGRSIIMMARKNGNESCSSCSKKN